MIFEGMRVIPVDHMTRAGKPIQIRRSIRERLFSRPWRPLATHKTIVPQVPSNEFILDRNREVIYAHPAMVQKLVDELAARHI